MRPVGRVTALRVPPAELAVIEHCGPPSDVDRAYGTLAAYVTQHALAVDGPLREYYLVGARDTPDSTRWRTEVCWPVFRTGPAAGGRPARPHIRSADGGGSPPRRPPAPPRR